MKEYNQLLEEAKNTNEYQIAILESYMLRKIEKLLNETSLTENDISKYLGKKKGFTKKLLNGYYYYTSFKEFLLMSLTIDVVFRFYFENDLND